MSSAKLHQLNLLISSVRYTLIVGTCREDIISYYTGRINSRRFFIIHQNQFVFEVINKSKMTVALMFDADMVNCDGIYVILLIEL